MSCVIRVTESSVHRDNEDNSDPCGLYQ